MSDNSPRDSISSFQVDKSDTMATHDTSISDTASIASSNPSPGAPHPTPANTVAGDLPSMEYVAQKVAGFFIGDAPIGRGHASSLTLTAKSSPEEELTIEYPEASNWAREAIEDLENALARMAMLAKDEHAVDNSKSVKELYSAHLAQVIKDGEIEFDLNFMK
ncbi:hypothetical protein TI39_contig4229g00004 [Zymoseptoria brevis]|uniref:Uncharacterized protein n=1 Tax=Zymoseptoria brevis TaxID=1047168 RepID=A0A0F4G9H9_9PEZI|nr:hypothetical protein TI39_contig4229g00004 [Zymoseptoria brevis]